jgi:hypothetical protein
MLEIASRTIELIEEVVPGERTAPTGFRLHDCCRVLHERCLIPNDRSDARCDGRESEFDGVVSSQDHLSDRHCIGLRSEPPLVA